MEREPRFFNQAYAADCCRGDPAFCTCACPFQLDVRDFITKILRGGFDAAYRKFRDAVIFPQIVTALCPSPCREVCPRGAVDAAISLRELEQAAIRYAHSLDPTNFNLSAKNDRIAVVGAGPSGLACALRLAAKKYQVTVFEKSSRLGGSLWQLLDPEVFLPDIERQGKYAAYELLLQREIIGPEQLEGFDGVYVATGKDGHPLGLDAGFDQDLLSTGKPGWFWGGALVGADPMAAIAQGGRAALHLEKYLKIKAMTFAPELKPQTRLQLEVTGLPLRPAVPAGAEGYTKAAAQAEAARCLRCDCSACYDYCDFMQYYRKYPRQLADAVDYGLTDSILETQTNNRMVNSCTGCGVCQAVCPLKVDSGGELQAAREQMLDKGLVPPAYHDFWLRDLEHATAPEIALTLPAPSGKHKFLLFPGCQLGASDPRYPAAALALLRQAEPDTALLLDCCGAPAYWAGERDMHQRHLKKLHRAWQELGCPQVICACPTCGKQLKLFQPEWRISSLYQVLAQAMIPMEIPKAPAPVYTLADPCSVKEDPGIRQGVTALLQSLDVQFDLLCGDIRQLPCCGFGGNIRGAAPGLAEEIAVRRTAASAHPYLTYCANCRDIYAAAGKPAQHILDLLCGLNGLERRPPHLSQRQNNRGRARALLLAEDYQEPAPAFSLEISEEQAAAMDKALLTENDLRRVIAFAEETGSYLLDGAGIRIAHLDLGIPTVWVEYRPSGEKVYQVIRAYTHRMKINERGRVKNESRNGSRKPGWRKS